MNDQQTKCMECQACCRYSMIPINPQRDHLKLLWLKNVPLFYNMKARYWAIYYESDCKYIDAEKGCLAYDDPKKKAEICPTYMCMQKDKTHWEDIKQGIVESRAILDAIFSGEEDGNIS